ncbi:hypothetical protein Glove_173g75 [Diversispora epigaea]|uniref:Uncharacterized protein n=1 Tax=Diversispora epigaea TaxID=1348612 RepID=A0A397IVE2_9GLOM|nr:hypothetical protein Glove_173g75 [Diversispora epigaea]
MNEFQVPTDLEKIWKKCNNTKSLLVVHLSTSSYNFGPLYAFWYFSFERMNGILNSLPNSHRQIELELMCRLINNNRINEMIYTENNTKGLEILNTRQSVGSLSEMDQFSHDEMRRFWMYSRTIQESTISGKEPFPGEMLKPFSENIPLLADGILDLMIAYYNDTYENLKFQKPFETDSINSIIIPLRINKYCRCRISSEIFGSVFSPRLYIINEMIYTENNTKGLEILNTRQSVGSLSEMDQFSHDEMRRFWMYSRTIQESTISGKEPFPGEMLKPFSENIPLLADGILDLMIAYYNDTYENLKFQKPFETDSINSIIIPLRINKYCRCRISSEIFAKFVSEDDSIDIYLGQIQFFFVYEISTNRINMENYYLAYVLHHILGRFVPVKYKISDRKNAKEYLAINPINRKYNLR